MNEIDEVPAGISVQPEAILGSFRDALAGVALLLLCLLFGALVCAACLTLLGGGLWLGGWLFAMGGLRYFLGVVLVLPFLYFFWSLSLWVCVVSLDILGVQLRGYAVYLALPIAPALAVVCGPVACFAKLGRSANPRNVFALLGVVFLIALGVVTLSPA